MCDLRDVYKATFDARSKWRNILLDLGVSNDTIEAIGERWQENPDDCYREGLAEWLKSGVRSWKDVVEALSSPTVGYNDMAVMVEQNHVHAAKPARNTEQQAQYQKITEDLAIHVNKILGEGAFGKVFEGTFKGQQCAVKVLHHVAMALQINLPAGRGTDKAVERFYQECDFIESFNHPNIIKHLSTAKHPNSDNILLVTELADSSLRNFLAMIKCGEQADLTNQAEISLSRDLASGLEYIHSKGIVHRDLCGDNVLLMFGQLMPTAKISDFGMSRLIEPSQLSNTLTLICNRMGYLPPEAVQIDDSTQYTQSFDLFSLGVIMLQIACRLSTVKNSKDRSVNLKKLPNSHSLKPTIYKCLKEARERITAPDLCAELTTKLEGALSTRIPTIYSNARRVSNMPLKMGYQIQSVVIDNALYVGGGLAQPTSGKQIVMKLENDQWTKLKKYKAMHFAMTSYAHKLILVGGMDQQMAQTNQIAVYNSNDWSDGLYPPMKYARDSATANTFDHHLIVCGGQTPAGRTSSVEILNFHEKEWYCAEPLPSPRSVFQATQADNTLYLMGGFSDAPIFGTVVLHVNLQKLVESIHSDKKKTKSLWNSLDTETPFVHSAPVVVQGCLLAIGGRDADTRIPQKAIYLYKLQSKDSKWVKAGDLQTARANPACSLLSNGEIVATGGADRLGTNQATHPFVNSTEFLSFIY